MAEKGAGLSILLQAGGYDRVHYALVLAAGAAAIGRPVVLFVTGRALLALLDGESWHGLGPADDGMEPAGRDALLEARGVATLGELLESVAALGVRIIACEMGWRALGIAEPTLRPDLDVECAGIVTLLGATPPGHQLVFV
ncbi:MAG TPA: hypothetical protein VED40_23475 [Azospirillaceae bacterium]|nr:hypothetical protein [Azospirillaceae bacterium]